MAEVRRIERIDQMRERLNAHHDKVDVAHKEFLLNSPARSPMSCSCSSPDRSGIEEGNLGFEGFNLDDNNENTDLNAHVSTPTFKPSKSRVAERQQRAERNRRRIMEDQVSKIREELRKVEDVVGRVKGAKRIQCFVRSKYSRTPPAQGDAERVKALADLSSSLMLDDANSTNMPFEQYQHLITSNPALVQLAISLLKPKYDSQVDGRGLLMGLMISRYPNQFLDDPSPEDRDTQLLKFLASRFPLYLNDSNKLSTVYGEFNAAFKKWRDKDKVELMDSLKDQCKGVWVLYLTEVQRKKVLSAEGVAKSAETERILLEVSENLKASKKHILRIRTTITRILGGASKEAEGKAMISECKRVAVLEVDLDDITASLELVVNPPPADVHEVAAEIARECVDSDPIPVNDAPAAGAGDAKSLFDDSSFVHHVLLTPKSELANISVTGVNDIVICPFSEFVGLNTIADSAVGDGGLDLRGYEGMNIEDIQAQIAVQMHKAFFNNLASALAENDFQPFFSVFQELTMKIKNLIPSRSDLHVLLPSVAPTSLTECEDLVRTTATLLKPLLSPDTSELLVPLTLNSPNVIFIVSPSLISKAMEYLLKHVSYCEMQITDYKVGKILPFLWGHGDDKERADFVTVYGDGEGGGGFGDIVRDGASVPALRAFIASAKRSLTAGASIEKTYKAAAIKEIVFSDSAVTLPETFNLDCEHFQTLRAATRLTVCANTIGLHVCSALRVPASKLAEEDISRIKDNLLLSLSGERVHHSDVIQITLDLAKAIGGEGVLTAGFKEAIGRKVSASMKQEDAVAKLMHKRTSTLLESSMVWEVEEGGSGGSNVPLHLRSGLLEIEDEEGNVEVDEEADFKNHINAEIGRLNLQFCGDELLSECVMFRRVVDLNWRVFGEVLIEGLWERC